jgi:DNA-binding SARP family transcriptional activator
VDEHTGGDRPDRTIHFGVLGPVQVIERGRDRTPSRSRLRGLLALLLLRANSPVSSSVLIHELYGDRPPTTAATALHVHVSQLRKTVFDERSRADSAQRLGTVRGGYSLRVGPDELDLFRFESLVAAADRKMAAAEPALAAAMFRQALRLWRGPALADCDAPVLVEVFAPWAEARRLDVLLRRIAAEMEAGSSAALVPELRSLVAEYPLVERMRAKLILALYRAGRQGAALAEYAELAALLRAELDCAPSSELQQLHQQILARDPALQGRRHLAVLRTHEPVTPAQLPRGPGTLHGRSDVVDGLVEALATGRRRCVVSGGPGSGTTAVTVAVAHQVRDRFPDGQLFATVDDSTTPADLLGSFLGALGHNGGDLPVGGVARARLLVAELTARRVLVVLDDVPAEWGGAALATLAGMPPGCALIANSPGPLPELGTSTRMRLGPLPDAAALELLAAGVGRRAVVDEVGAATEIVRRCGRMPLAIRIVAARAGGRPHWSLQAVARRLAGPRLLTELAVGDVGVRSSLLRRYERCAGTERSEFRSLGRLDALRGALPGADVDVVPGVHITPRAAAGIAATGLLENTVGAPGYVLRPLCAALARELWSEEAS